MAHARLWWFMALLVVPAVLAAFALLWVDRPSAPPAAAAAPLPAPAPDADADADQPSSAAAAEQLRIQLVDVLAAHPIRFSADSAELAGPPAETVRRVAELLVAGPAVPVVVEGHVADTPGGLEAGRRLSERRAAVVAEQLVVAGVPAERISTRGLGAERPLGTVEESRRVEITVG